MRHWLLIRILCQFRIQRQSPSGETSTCNRNEEAWRGENRSTRQERGVWNTARFGKAVTASAQGDVSVRQGWYLRAHESPGNSRWVDLKNRTLFTGVACVCILLCRLCYPNRLWDLQAVFGRGVSELHVIVNHMLDFIYQRWHHLMDTLHVAWLTAQCLQEGAAATILTVCGTLLMGQWDPLQSPPIANGCFTVGTSGYMPWNFRTWWHYLALSGALLVLCWDAAMMPACWKIVACSPKLQSTCEGPTVSLILHSVTLQTRYVPKLFARFRVPKSPPD